MSSIRGSQPSQRPSLDNTGSSEEQLRLRQAYEKMSSMSLRSVSDPGGGIVPMLPGLQRNVSVRHVMEEVDDAIHVGSVVQLYATGVKPSYTSPWMVSSSIEWTGSGFCISDKRIVTNAHNAEHATVLQVQRQDHPKKWRARATTLAHDLDLAIIEVDDDEFWTDAVVATLAPASHAVDLYSEINAIGFPTGGSTLCVTKGVISRFDTQLYAHPSVVGVVEESKNSPGPVFILQVDSAVNPGNSGGPAIDQMGRVVGVASSGLEDSQNIGYVIPISIIHLFLDEVERTGQWAGVSELGLSCRDLESDSYRAFLGMQEGDTGILVQEVAPLGALDELVQAGDVLTHIDSLRVSNEGKVPISISGQRVYCSCEALVTCKPKGEETEFTLLRKDGSDGGTLKSVTVSVPMRPVPPLAPRFHGFDAHPDYVLIGGIIFSRLAVPIFRQVTTHSLFNCIDKYKKSDEHEAVIIVNILRHDINIGCEMDDAPLKSVNGVAIKNLRQLAEIAQLFEEPPKESEGEEEFVRFCLEKINEEQRTELPDIVLQRSKIFLANQEICEAYAVSHTITPRLLGKSQEQ